MKALLPTVLLKFLACGALMLSSALDSQAAPPDDKQLYPRTKEEIAAKLKEIAKRTAKPGEVTGKNKKQTDMLQAAATN